MNSIEAIDYAIRALRAKRARLTNTEAFDRTTDAIETLAALREVLADNERATREVLASDDDDALDKLSRGPLPACDKCGGVYQHVPSCPRRARGGMRRSELPSTVVRKQPRP